MFGDYEDLLREKLEALLQSFTLEEILERVGLTDTEALIKLIMDGHIDEADLPTAC